MTLIGTDGDELGQCAIRGWSGAGAPEHDGLAAEIDLAAFAVGAKAAGTGWVYGYALAHFDGIYTRRNRGHFSRKLVAENEGPIGDKGGVASVFVVMQISAANTHAAGTQQHHAGV